MERRGPRRAPGSRGRDRDAQSQDASPVCPPARVHHQTGPDPAVPHGSSTDSCPGHPAGGDTAPPRSSCQAGRPDAAAAEGGPWQEQCSSPAGSSLWPASPQLRGHLATGRGHAQTRRAARQASHCSQGTLGAHGSGEQQRAQGHFMVGRRRVATVLQALGCQGSAQAGTRQGVAQDTARVSATGQRSMDHVGPPPPEVPPRHGQPSPAPTGAAAAGPEAPARLGDRYYWAPRTAGHGRRTGQPPWQWRPLTEKNHRPPPPVTWLPYISSSVA